MENMNIGKQIKRLRTEKNIIQETLADHLGVSAQAVSKWENGVTAPDISLLPEISVFFGVKIDELFRLPMESHYERIENMLVTEREISDENFRYAEDFLNDMLASNHRDARSFTNLAALYNHRARSLGDVAADYAKAALQLEPDNKQHHVALWDALHAVCGDEYYDNHFEVIEYYKTFIEEHPKSKIALTVVIENMLTDKRYQDASLYIDKLKDVRKDYLIDVYQGDVEYAKGNIDKAFSFWNKAVDEYPSTWQALCCRADRLRNMGESEKAIADYEKCMEVQGSPRMTDPLLSLAQLYETQKEYQKAINARERQLDVLEEDFAITSGEAVDFPRREIQRLMALQ